MTDIEFMLDVLKIDELNISDKSHLGLIATGFRVGYELSQSKAETQLRKEKYDLIDKYENIIALLTPEFENV